MRRIFVVLGAAAVMAAAVALAAGAALSQTSPSGTLDANSLPKIDSPTGTQGVMDTFFPAKAQTFTAMNSGALTSAQIQMYKQCDAAGDVRMQIATTDDSGLPTTNILAETTLPASAFPTDAFPGVGDLVMVTFSNPAQVEAGQKYAFIFRLETPNDNCRSQGANGPYFQPLKGDVYSGGTYAFFPDYPEHPHAGQWGLSTDRDHVFAIYVTPDTTAPRVDAVSPANGTKDVARSTSVTAIFSEKMDPDSVSGTTFKLYKVNADGGTRQIANAPVTLSEDGLTATLDPYGASTTRLAPDTKYMVVVTTGTADLAGNALDQNATREGNQPKRWAFITR